MAANNPQTHYEIPEQTVWSSLWKIAVSVALVGALGTTVGYLSDVRRFAFSYLFAFAVFLTLALGALFFILIQHLTAAGWSVTVRRIAEHLAGALPVLLILFIPIWFSGSKLYPWQDTHHVAQETHQASGDKHATARAEHSSQKAEHALHEQTLQKKKPYLNKNRFSLFGLIYFGIWIAISVFFVNTSLKQDHTKEVGATRRMERWAPLATIGLALSLTFAAFDWLMSLEPGWYSTIYGVYIFANSMVFVLAVVTVIAVALSGSGLVGKAINTEHLHDLGKLLFGFLVFWAYIAFSQLLLIWYASIPEETTFYHYRWDSLGWRNFSLFILFAKFIVPFFYLLSRNVKRRMALLQFGAAWIIFMQVVEIYWFVLPYYKLHHFSLHLLDLAALFLVGGIYFAVVFYRMKQHALVPIGDPRFDRALHFHNA